MENKVEWRDIPEYEGIYQVSNDGRVKSLKRPKVREDRIIKGLLGNHGYNQVHLSKNGVVKAFRVHQLVATVFLGHKPNGYTMVVDHINNKKLDNRVENLQLISHEENVSKGNSLKENSSSYLGVSWNKQKRKWQSNICIEGKKIYLGYFDTEIVAHRAYQNAKNEIKTNNQN